MPRVRVRRCGHALGAEITGVDATKPLDRTTVAAIRKAWLDNVVVFLPGQNLSPEQLRAFCGQFGELDVENIRLLPLHPEMPEVVVRANQPTVAKEKAVVKSPPADYWHSDFSFRPRPSTATFLLAKALPEIGGDTMFANMYAAYETLSPRYRELVDSLTAIHDISVSPAYSFRRPEIQAKAKELNPPFLQRVVHVHPETGRKALFLGSYVHKFAGMTDEETRPILDFLHRHATRHELVYRHRWSVNDVVIWDNRCSLHYAVQDYDPQMRLMLRCSLVGPESGKRYDEAESTVATGRG